MPEAGQTTQPIIDFSILTTQYKFKKAFWGKVSVKKTVYAQMIFRYACMVKCWGLTSTVERGGDLFV